MEVNLIVVLTGDIGVGKKTIANILAKTENFTIKPFEELDFKNSDDRIVTVIEPNEFFSGFLRTRSEWGRPLTDIVFCIKRDNTASTILGDNVHYQEHVDFFIDNSYIIKTIEQIIKIHDYSLDAYKYYIEEK